MVEEGLIGLVRLLLRSFLVVCLLFPFLSASKDPEENTTPFLLQFTDDAAQIAQIGILRETPVPEGEREIRVWIGFGILRLDSMMRLRIGADGEAKGDILKHFRMSGLTAEEAAELRAVILKTCVDWKQGEETETCIGEFRRRQDWNRVYKKLMALGVDRLPDQSELPELDFEVNDGVAMVVEVRDGTRYRAYEYSNPVFRTEPEAVAAHRIMEEISKVMAKTKQIE